MVNSDAVATYASRDGSTEFIGEVLLSWLGSRQPEYGLVFSGGDCCSGVVVLAHAVESLKRRLPDRARIDPSRLTAPVR
jgi:hypothetical protein